MNKSVKSGDNAEVIPPKKGANVTPCLNDVVPGKHPDRVTLQTPGQIKSEMGRVYRAVLKGRTSEVTGKTLIRDMLTPMLKATEIEQEFNLAMDDPESDTPAMTGLSITGPEPSPQDGSTARCLDRNEITTIEPTRERKDDEKETDGDRTKPRS